MVLIVKFIRHQNLIGDCPECRPDCLGELGKVNRIIHLNKFRSLVNLLRLRNNISNILRSWISLTCRESIKNRRQNNVRMNQNNKMDSPEHNTSVSMDPTHNLIQNYKKFNNIANIINLSNK